LEEWQANRSSPSHHHVTTDQETTPLARERHGTNPFVDYTTQEKCAIPNTGELPYQRHMANYVPNTISTQVGEYTPILRNNHTQQNHLFQPTLPQGFALDQTPNDIPRHPAPERPRRASTNPFEDPIFNTNPFITCA